MRRCSLAALSLLLLASLLLVAEPASAATTTKSASCTDGGGHRWSAKAVWGGVYSAGATKKVSARSVKFTTKSVKYVDYTIKVVDGTGHVVETTKRVNRKFSFKKGKRSLSTNPKNPASAPGRTKIVLTVGDGKDGKAGCTVTFVQPGKPASAPSGGTCAPGREVVKFDGQGSAGLGQYGQGNYDASAELWGVNGYSYEQTMGVCTHDAWYTDVKTDNRRGDGAVKAYPSMRRIYWDYSVSGGNMPLVSSFPRLKVDFGSKDPSSCPGCIYDTAFDVWLNGIGNGTANELMIWTHNVNQRPYGTKVASGIKLAGHTWDLWSGASNHYLAYVPTDTSYIRSGSLDIKDFTANLGKRLPAKTKIGQISYGVETVSTNDVTRHWDFTKFTVTDS